MHIKKHFMSAFALLFAGSAAFAVSNINPQTAWFYDFGTPQQGQINSPAGVDMTNPCSVIDFQIVCHINGATAYADDSLSPSVILRKNL